MRIIHTVREMHETSRALRRDQTLGLVPTMGALHDGHLSLMARAAAECDALAASIFVNPTQFAPGEDFEKYPRTFEEDCAKLEAAGVEVLFAPSASEMYMEGATTFVEVGAVGDRLDGASRPGHFRGVATVVSKLFNIVAPDRAYFGQKDAAQVAVLRAMVRDLNMAVELVACPIVREPDGLAMSSRNRYLSPADRQRALILHKTLDRANAQIQGGETHADTLKSLLLTILAEDANLRLDYAEVVDSSTLLPVSSVGRGTLIAVAAWFGSTRLIDNLIVGGASNDKAAASERNDRIPEVLHA